MMVLRYLLTDKLRIYTINRFPEGKLSEQVHLLYIAGTTVCFKKQTFHDM